MKIRYDICSMAVSGLARPPAQNLFQSLSLFALISGSSIPEHLHLKVGAHVDHLLQVLLLEQRDRGVWTEALEWGFKKVRVLDVMLLHENTLDSPKKIDLVCVEVVLLNHESLERLLYLFLWIRELVKAEYLLDELDERTSVMLVYFLEILLGD